MKLQSASLWRASVLLLTLAGTHGALADNSRGQARNIGTDPASYGRSDMVGATDPMDYYKFTLRSKRSVTATLTGLSGDADLYLQGNNGTYLFSANRGSGVSESIRKNLEPGEYHILVYGWAGSVNYRLQLNTVSANPPPAQVRTLGPLDGMNGRNTAVNASGTIAPATGWIDYRFSLPGDRQIQIRGQGNVAAGVTPSNGVSRWKMLQNNRLNTTLAAGNYHLRVFRNPRGAESFSFAIMAKPINTNDTAGYNTRTARNLGRIGNPPTKVKEYVGEHDFDDYYRVNVSPNSVLNVALAHRYGSNADVFVYDPLGRRVAQSRNRGSANENISFNALQGGVYHVQVGIADRRGPSWENAGYTINIGTVPMRVSAPSGNRGSNNNAGASNNGHIEPNNNRESTPDLFGRGTGILQTSPITEPTRTVGGSDPSDWIQFTVGCNTALNKPRFTVSYPSTVNLVVRQIKTRGQPRNLPGVSSGAVLTPETEIGQNTYLFKLQVTSATGAPVQYALTGTKVDCQGR